MLLNINSLQLMAINKTIHEATLNISLLPLLAVAIRRLRIKHLHTYNFGVRGRSHQAWLPGLMNGVTRTPYITTLEQVGTFRLSGSITS